jgi:hypothetical protein
LRAILSRQAFNLRELAGVALDTAPRRSAKQTQIQALVMRLDRFPKMPAPDLIRGVARFSPRNVSWETV